MTDEQIFEIAEKEWQNNRDNEREFTLRFARALLAASTASDKQEAQPISDDYARLCSPEWLESLRESDKQEASWAPERIWLQRGVGEEGSHTWCEHQIGEDSIGDAIEEAEYVRADAASLGKQQPVAEVIKWRTFTGHTAWDFKVFDQTLEHGAKLYAAPLATPSDKQEAVAYEVIWPSGEQEVIYASALHLISDLGDFELIPLYAAPLASSVAEIEDPVIAPRGLLGAACAAIEKKHPAPKTLAALRAITMAPRTAPSVADAVGASEPLPENIDWTRVMALAEKYGHGWSNGKGWSFYCDDDLFNFASELAKESGND